MELVGLANRIFTNNEDDSINAPSSIISASSTAATTSTTNENERPSSGSSNGGRRHGSPGSAPRAPIPASRSATAVSSSVETHRLELTAEFHRLNILLMRIDKAASAPGAASAATGKEPAFKLLDYPKQAANKVATLTLAQAKIQASCGHDSSSVEGSLGGLNVCDITPTCGR